MKGWAWADILLYLWQSHNGLHVDELMQAIPQHSQKELIQALMPLYAYGFLHQVDSHVYLTARAKPVCKRLEGLKNVLDRYWGEL